MAFSERPSEQQRGDSEHAPRPGRHAKSHWTGGTVVAAVVAVVVVLSGLGVLLANQSNRPWPPTGQVPAAAHSAGRSTAQPAANDTPPATQALAACHSVWSAQDRALRAARRSMHQWQVHVGAMNQLVSGQITFAQASTFWANTRVGAMHRVKVFERADRARKTLSLQCAVPSGAAMPTVSACVHGVQVRDQTLAAAARAIATWKSHITDMEMLRMGTMSPATASRMWIKSWHRGQHQIDHYQTLRHQDRAQHC